MLDMQLEVNSQRSTKLDPVIDIRVLSSLAACMSNLFSDGQKGSLSDCVYYT